MSDLNTITFDDQHVELLPARTQLTLLGLGGGSEGFGHEGHGHGHGGDSYSNTETTTDSNNSSYEDNSSVDQSADTLNILSYDESSDSNEFYND